jgi:hypothetical protein
VVCSPEVPGELVFHVILATLHAHHVTWQLYEYLYSRAKVKIGIFQSVGVSDTEPRKVKRPKSKSGNVHS